MIAASRLIQQNADAELADKMAQALRNVGNILNTEERFSAYFRAGIDLINTNVREQHAADEVALSIEMMLRDAGRQ